MRKEIKNKKSWGCRTGSNISIIFPMQKPLLNIKQQCNIILLDLQQNKVRSKVCVYIKYNDSNDLATRGGGSIHVGFLWAEKKVKGSEQYCRKDFDQQLLDL